MKKDNLIHIKLEYPEAVQSKRDILGTQRDLIEILRIVKRYHIIRLQEMKLKEILFRKNKELRTSLSKLNLTFPRIKLPEIIAKDTEYETREEIKKIKETPGKNLKGYDLERELADIQKRLKDLE